MDRYGKPNTEEDPITEGVPRRQCLEENKLRPLSHPVELLEAIFICKVTAEENKRSGRSE